MLTSSDGNSSYFNLDMLYTDAQLLTQVELEYYVNKTGKYVIFIQRPLLTSQVHGLPELSIQ
jgi:hypothetical protein